MGKVEGEKDGNEKLGSGDGVGTAGEALEVNWATLLLLPPLVLLVRAGGSRVMVVVENAPSSEEEMEPPKKLTELDVDG